MCALEEAPRTDESVGAVSGINVGATGGASSLIKSISAKAKDTKDKETAREEAIKAAALAEPAPPPTASTSAQPWNASKLSTNKSAASLTSTTMDVHTQTDRMLYDEEELMFEAVKDKGYVQLKTNFGDINLELYCQQVRGPDASDYV
jgi:peptidyl-prolyl cis-trans isomerase-like protein 2